MPDATKPPEPWSDEWIDTLWKQHSGQRLVDCPPWMRALFREVAAKAMEEAAKRCMSPVCKRRIRARAREIEQ